jgi:alpha-tubulin suppressor-like RCC1 family protein
MTRTGREMQESPAGAKGIPRVGTFRRRTALLALWAALVLFPLRGTAQALWSWGDNRHGQLGDGTTAPSSAPVLVSPLTGLTDVTALAGGGGHSLALTGDGTVWAWGSNRYGQIANGAGAHSSLPFPVTGLTGAIAVAAGRSHSLALRQDGSVWAWGANRAGQLGDGTRMDSALPVRVRTATGPLTGIKAIAAGGDRSLALRQDGSIWAWGAEPPRDHDDRASFAAPVTTPLGTLSGVTAIAAGRDHCLALTADGTVWAWGSNSAGQLGDGTFANSSVPVRVSGLAGASAIAAGGKHSLAVQGGGTVWAWGSYKAGRPGAAAGLTSALPVQVPALWGVTAVAAEDDRSFALRGDGTVWAFESIVEGRPGEGAAGLPAPVPGLSEVVTIAAGGGHLLAVVEGCPAITVSPASLPNGTVGTAYSQTISASGGTAPYTFAVSSGSLPPGLALNGTTGLLSGTPSALGTFPFTLTATDASGGVGLPPCAGSQGYSVVIGCPAIVLAPSSLPNGAVGTAFSQTITAGGGTAPYTYAVTSGSLPPGLVLNGTSGLLSGTPTANGSYPFTITATDSSGAMGTPSCSGNQPYTLVIDPASCPTIVLAPPSLPGGTTGNPYAQTIVASGGASPYTFAVTGGSLPPGLALNGTTGVLSGTPTATGSSSFTLTATDARGCPGSQAYTVVVACPAIALSPPSLPGATVGVAYSQAIVASGGAAPFAFAVTGGNLPAGFALNGSTGMVSGTTLATGSHLFTVTVTDAFGCSSSQAYTLTVVCPTIVLSPASLPNATVSVAYSQTIVASGGTAPYAYAVTAGSLPAGFSLNGSTGVLAGAPSSTGTFSFTLTATDAYGCAGAKSYTLTVTTCTNPPVWMPTASMAAARQGHTATLLLGGKVLVAGGNGSSNPASALSSAEIYNPATATWSPTGSLVTARGSQKAVLLSNGKVLAAGGLDASGSPLSSAEIYDPAAGTWGSTGPVATARYNHTMTMLPSGKVLVVGGNGYGGPFATAQVYDPGTGTWSVTGSLAVARSNHTATLLPNGKVLVAGGTGSSGFLASAQIYDPSSGTWTATAPMASARTGHTATLLSNGKVLVAGGLGSGLLASAEIYDPAAGTWSPTGFMLTARFYHSETLLLSGKVLVAGGSGGAGFLASSELYDPAAGTWSASGSMATTREFHTATRLPNGKVLVTGGWKGSLGLSGAELFDPAPCYPTVTVFPASLPISTVSASYSQRITASGGCEPYTYEILEGGLPDGLALETATGELSGVPSSAGTYAFTVVARAIVDQECAGSQSYFLAVVDPPVVSSIKKAVPFGLVVKGGNLQNGIAVFIAGDEAPWPNVTWKSSAKVALGGGRALKERFPKGAPTTITFVNPDGGRETGIWTR